MGMPSCFAVDLHVYDGDSRETVTICVHSHKKEISSILARDIYLHYLLSMKYDHVEDSHIPNVTPVESRRLSKGMSIKDDNIYCSAMSDPIVGRIFKGKG